MNYDIINEKDMAMKDNQKEKKDNQKVILLAVVLMATLIGAPYLLGDIDLGISKQTNDKSVGYFVDEERHSAVSKKPVGYSVDEELHS